MTDGGESVTRSGWLELKDEHRLMQEGYEFLDEKRMILAAEMLDRLREHDARAKELDADSEGAIVALARALARHGLDDLYAAPAARFRALTPEVTSRNLLGVRVDEGAAAPTVDPPTRTPVEPTPELRALEAAYRALVPKLFAQAVAQGTLLRLADEYERTERRARALENVLLPELEDRLRFMGEQLEAMDQEDVVRVRFRR